MLDILNTNINSLGRSIALYLFVYNNASYLLGSIRDMSRFTMETCAGHSFLNSVHPLLSTLALFLLIHMFVGSQGNSFMFSKRPGEHRPGASPPFLVLVILEDEGSNQKAEFKFFINKMEMFS